MGAADKQQQTTRWEDQPFNSLDPGTYEKQIAGRRRLISAKPSPLSSLEFLLAVVTLIIWLGSVCVAPFGLVYLLIRTLKGSILAGSILACIVADVWLPAGKPNKPFLIVQVPHGVYPFAGLLALSQCGLQGSGVPATVVGTIADVFFQLPVVRHVYTGIGSISADRQVMVRTLKGPHPHVALHPEGIAGIFRGASRRREAVYLRGRKGFIKLAIETGADLVPLYYLGQSQLLTFWGSEWLSRKCRATVGVFWGWKGTLVPRPHPIIALVGDPIPVEQHDHPSQEQIDRLHAQLLAAIEQLYNDHRHLVGWESKPLSIV